MPYFTFTFREQVFQAQYDVVTGSSPAQYRITDLPDNLRSFTQQDILLQLSDGNIVQPGWDLGDAISDGLNQSLKGIHHL